MLKPRLIDSLARELDDLREAGTYKVEHELEGPQGSRVTVGGRSVVMLTSNNYLGLANHRMAQTAQMTGLVKRDAFQIHASGRAQG